MQSLDDGPFRRLASSILINFKRAFREAIQMRLCARIWEAPRFYWVSSKKPARFHEPLRRRRSPRANDGAGLNRTKVSGEVVSASLRPGPCRVAPHPGPALRASGLPSTARSRARFEYQRPRRCIPQADQATNPHRISWLQWWRGDLPGQGDTAFAGDNSSFGGTFGIPRRQFAPAGPRWSQTER